MQHLIHKNPKWFAMNMLISDKLKEVKPSNWCYFQPIYGDSVLILTEHRLEDDEPTDRVVFITSEKIMEN